MSDRIAKEDIVEVNAAGQSVVVVPAGQPIPKGVAEPKAEAAKPKPAAPAKKRPVK